MRLATLVSAGIAALSINVLIAGGGGATKVKKEDIPKHLKTLTSSPNAADRRSAVNAIADLGALSKKYVVDAVEPLKKAVQADSDPGVRKSAARALGQINPDPTTTVPILIEALKKDSSMDVKLTVAESLGMYGKAAVDALPLLREFGNNFKDKKDKNQSMVVKTAIGNITGAKKK